MAKLVTLSGNYSPGGAWLKPYHENETMSGWWTDLKNVVKTGAEAIAGKSNTPAPNNTALWVTVAVLGTVTLGLAVTTMNKKTRRRRRYS